VAQHQVMRHLMFVAVILLAIIAFKVAAAARGGSVREVFRELASCWRSFS
jgi:hypothetical protein